MSDIINANNEKLARLFVSLNSAIDNVEIMVKNYSPTFNGERYLTNVDICRLLHLSLRTLQEYRDTGKIGYIQISGKILYRETEIMKLLADNYTRPF